MLAPTAVVLSAAFLYFATQTPDLPKITLPLAIVLLLTAVFVLPAAVDLRAERRHAQAVATRETASRIWLAQDSAFRVGGTFLTRAEIERRVVYPIKLVAYVVGDATFRATLVHADLGEEFTCAPNPAGPGCPDTDNLD